MLDILALEIEFPMFNRISPFYGLLKLKSFVYYIYKSKSLIKHQQDVHLNAHFYFTSLKVL